MYLEPQERGSGAARHKLEQFALLFIRERSHDSPEGSDDRVLGGIASCDRTDRHLVENKFTAGGSKGARTTDSQE